MQCCYNSCTTCTLQYHLQFPTSCTHFCNLEEKGSTFFLKKSRGTQTVISTIRNCSPSVFLVWIGRLPLWPNPIKKNHIEQDPNAVEAITLVLDTHSTDQDDEWQPWLEGKGKGNGKGKAVSAHTTKVYRVFQKDLNDLNLVYFTY